MEKQGSLFNVEKTWEEEWKEMPEFVQEYDLKPKYQVIISLNSFEDVKEMAKRLGYESVTPTLKSIWFPKKTDHLPKEFLYTDKKETK